MTMPFIGVRLGSFAKPERRVAFGEAGRDRGSGFPSRQRQKAKRSGGVAKAAKSRQPQGERRSLAKIQGGV
jgi:hypothetical protein